MPADKGTCKVVYMENGEPKECGGKIKDESINEPFGSYTAIGGSRQPIFTYKYCSKCGVMLNR